VSASGDLSALLGSRICHDLISPLGAIGNGVELLAMSGAGSAPEIALIAESVENANARIRQYRIAFGIASRNQGLSASEIRGILGDVYRQSRMVVSWQIDSDCTRGEVKLAFLILLCYETALPWGGRVSVQRDGGSWTFHGSAERMSVAEDLWKMLEDANAGADLTSAQVHFALAPEAAAKIGRSCSVSVEPGLLSVRF
jgi:histidine phosphotransferase ChpT